jgi:hypothetical protein
MFAVERRVARRRRRRSATVEVEILRLLGAPRRRLETVARRLQDRAARRREKV